MDKVITAYKNVCMGALTMAIKDISPHKMSLKSTVEKSKATYKNVLRQAITVKLAEELALDDPKNVSFTYNMTGFDFRSSINVCSFRPKLRSPIKISAKEKKQINTSSEEAGFYKRMLLIAALPLLIQKYGSKFLKDKARQEISRRGEMEIETFRTLIDEALDRYSDVSESFPGNIDYLLAMFMSKLKHYGTMLKDVCHLDVSNIDAFLRSEINEFGVGINVEGFEFSPNNIEYGMEVNAVNSSMKGIASIISLLWGYKLISNNSMNFADLIRTESSGVSGKPFGFFQLPIMNIKNFNWKTVSYQAYSYGHTISDSVFKSSNMANFKRLQNEPQYLEVVKMSMDLTKSGFFVNPEAENKEELLKSQIKSEIDAPLFLHVFGPAWNAIYGMSAFSDYYANIEFFEIVPTFYTEEERNKEYFVLKDRDNYLNNASAVISKTGTSSTLEIKANDMLNPEKVKEFICSAANQMAFSLSF